ncbi:hypothetical protein TSOC_006323 [Tetrabaena socialis]|uniref:Uncharacterized protein n=1 Tax=Tetrabaena socialis TaxID=47790 RepID=A0A2J8A3W1_9CHLO|nr:hypothetical protein TSOC_006323 [Tetrabaena socialis]|eukprot:PNH07220.1 hypothetical protein TSOC_006323 [Tetrabaena socialis]
MGWPVQQRTRAAQARTAGEQGPPLPGLARRGARLVASAKSKGFGGLTMPKFPALGGKKGGAPAGGVAPAPPIDLAIPAEVEQQWARAQREWVQYSIERPVLLPGLDSAVYLLPVGGDAPGDAALIRDVVAAVQPDAIALESPPQHLKSYTAAAKSLEPLLACLLAADLSSAASAARAALTQAQREEWQAGLLAACRGASFKPDADQLAQLFSVGSLPFVEWLVPAHLARAAAGLGQGQAPLLVSCGMDRQARAAAPAPSLFLGREFDVYLEEVGAALGEGLETEVDAWRTALGDRLDGAGGGREVATLVASWEAQRCVGPAAQRGVAERVEARMRAERRAKEEERAAAAAAAGKGKGKWKGSGVAAGAGAGAGAVPAAAAAEVVLEVVRTASDAWVAGRLVGLAEGKDVVRRCRRIVAVVGRVHVLSIEEELRKLAAAL